MYGCGVYECGVYGMYEWGICMNNNSSLTPLLYEAKEQGYDACVHYLEEHEPM